MELNANCTPPYSLTNGTCNCNGGYEGADCRTLISWWLPFQWIVFILTAFFTAFFFAWSVLKLIHVIFLQPPKAASKGRRVNLSFVSMLLNVIGNGLRLALRSMKPIQLTMEYGNVPIGQEAAVVTLNATSAACWIASLALIMAFWVTALHAKLAVKMAVRTKILCFLAASVVLIMIPGMILATVMRQLVLGATIILIPYVIDSLFFITTTLVLRMGCCLPKNAPTISDNTQKKLNYVYRYLTVASVAWIFLTIFGGFGGILQGMPGFGTISTFFVAISNICEFVAIWGTMMLVERKIGLRRLVVEVLTWTKNTSTLERTSTGISKTPRSAMSTGMHSQGKASNTEAMTTSNRSDASTKSLTVDTVVSTLSSTTTISDPPENGIVAPSNTVESAATLTSSSSSSNSEAAHASSSSSASSMEAPSS